MQVSISMLGGVGEIGMNMYVYETDTSAIIMDCGVKFGSAAEPGIDLVIPSFEYIESIKRKVKCVILTHAHEDHIGAMPFLLQKYKFPVATTAYTFDMLAHKLSFYDNIKSFKKTYIKDDFTFHAGDFDITSYKISHSVPETYAFLIKAGGDFLALHASDYKLDFSDDCSLASFGKLSKFKNRLEFDKHLTGASDMLKKLSPEDSSAAPQSVNYAENIEKLSSMQNARVDDIDEFDNGLDQQSAAAQNQQNITATVNAASTMGAAQSGAPSFTFSFSKEDLAEMVGKSIDKKFLEEVLRDVISKNIHEIVTRIVPDIAEKCIKEELQKLNEGVDEAAGDAQNAPISTSDVTASN